MFDEILPPGVAVVAARRDLAASLFPEEEELIGRAVERRRREFTTARACARSALLQLGFPSLAIGAGPRGEPLWPAGVVGSITHCHGYRAAAVASAESFLTIGIDAEPREELPDGVLDAIATPPERAWLHRFSAAGTCWDRLLFSAKESVYKACDSFTSRSLRFEDATVTIDPVRQTFSARLAVPAIELDAFAHNAICGRWQMRDGFILTAIGLRRITC